jgi:protease-4
LPGRVVLTADWRAPIGEGLAPPDLLNLELSPPRTVSEVVLALDAAAADPRVAGLLVRVAETSHGFAVAQELRDAVLRFRAAGKFAVAHADSFGELSSGNEGYYLATGFEQVALQPAGLVGLTGLAAQVPLARELLAGLGVELEVSRRAEYKSALESLTADELSAPNREQLEALLDTLTRQLVAGVAAGRRLGPERVRELIDRGPFTGLEALRAGLIDFTQHYDEARTAAIQRVRSGGVGAPVGTIGLSAYADRLAPAGAGAPKVALVRAAGLIRRGEGALGAGGIAAEDLAGILEDAARDDDVRAVLLRIDSGGGSAVASETIARGVRRVREAGKPVVVSMSNAAASGGYWIAMGANRIVAQPATLTGSIGVVAGKPNLAGAWDRLGVRWAEILRGDQAGIWSVNRPYSEAGRARVEAIVGALYDDFTAGVARGRNLAPERVAEIARGRVWAGEDALGLGLVDELGGLGTALAAVRRSLQLPADAPLDVELLPEDENPLRAAWRRLRPLAAGLDGVAAVLRALDGAAATAAGTAVSLPLVVR